MDELNRPSCEPSEAKNRLWEDRFVPPFPFLPSRALSLFLSLDFFQNLIWFRFFFQLGQF
jgi:hypothetical protein